jgi:hypothetical protein
MHRDICVNSIVDKWMRIQSIISPFYRSSQNEVLDVLLPACDSIVIDFYFNCLQKKDITGLWCDMSYVIKLHSN